MNYGASEFASCIKFGKLKKVKYPWHKYLEGRKLMLFTWSDSTYNLIGIYGENNGLDGLCEYVWKNDAKAAKEDGYKSLEEFKEDVYLGNNGFGFDKDEIELCHLEG